jgi:anti-sigma B factor antagonist
LFPGVRREAYSVTEWLEIWPAFSAVAWTDGEYVRIDVAGEIDLATCAQLETELLAAIEAPTPPKRVRIDLAAVTFIDARGVAVLVDSRDAAQRRGVDFAVQNAQGIVLRVLDILGLAALQSNARDADLPKLQP